MSRTVDQRVVEMRFDNKQFESNVKTSMSTLEKLKKSLHLEGAAKGLENVGSAAKKIDLSGVSGAVETVQARFSGLQVVAMTALANITNSAINAGKQLVSAFTIEPVTTGFQEYELKMGSVQTIMASTGASLEEVNGYLDELNTYSDKTIYSFADMTNNIGKFTNAGVKLEDAVKAIQGISNEAAVSGANANEASHAMYNFAQALSSGAVKLIDWKSIENANMATVEFKNELIKTAVELGTVVEESGRYKTTTTDLNGKVSDLFDSMGNFNDSLSHQWMTSEVLIKTLGRYADETTEIGKKAFASAQDVKTFSMMMDTLKEAAQSGWAATWELLIGDFNQAKTIFTDLSELFGDMIGKSADARNNLLKGALGAREIDVSSWKKFVSEVGVSGSALEKALKETAREHDIAIDQMIEKEGSFAATLKDGWLTTDIITETLKKFTGQVGETTMGLEDLEKIANLVMRGDYGNGEARIKALTEAGYDYATVQGYVNHVMLGTEFNLAQLSDEQLKNAGYTQEQIRALRELAKTAEETGTPLNELMGSMNKPTGRELLIESFKNTFQALVKVIGAVKGAYRDIFPAMTSMRLYDIIEGINKFTKGLIVSDKTAKNIRRTFRGFFAVLDIGCQGIGVLVRGFKDLVRFVLPAGDGVLGITAGIGDFLVKIDKAVKSSGAFNKGLDALEKLLAPVGAGVKKVSGIVTGAVTSFIDWANKNDILAKSISGLWKGIRVAVEVVRVLIDTFLELPVVRQNVEKLHERISSLSNGLKEYFSGGIQVVSAFIKRAESVDGITFDNIKGVLRDFKDNVLSYFIDIDGIFGRFRDALDKFRDRIGDGFDLKDIQNGLREFKDNLVSGTGGIIDNLLNLAKNIATGISVIKDVISDNFWAIMTVFVGVGLLAALKKISGVLDAIKSPVEAFTGVLDGISSSLNAYSTKLKAEAIYTIAKSIAVLAGSIAVLSMLDPAKVWSSVAALAIISGALVGLSILVNKFGGDKKVSFPILSIAAGIFILVTALKKMEELDGSLIVRNLVVLGVLGYGLTTFAAILSIVAPKLSSGGFFLLAFSISLHILVDALKDMDSLRLDNLGQTIAILLGTLAGLVLIAKICKDVKAGSAITILAAVIALKVLIGVFDDVADIDAGTIVKGLAVIGTVFGMFSVLMAASMLAGENAAKGGVGILAMSAGVVLIVHALKEIAGMDQKDLDQSMGVVKKLLKVFAYIVMMSKYAGKNAMKAGAMLLMMSGAILILSAVMMLLSHLDPSGLARALGAVVALEVVFGALIAVTSMAKDCKSTLLILSATIAILVIALATLSMIDPTQLGTASASLSAVIATFALLIKSTAVGKKAKKALPAVAAMVLLVGALAGILYLLASLQVGSTLEVAASISALMLSLSAAMFIISKAGKVSPEALITVGVMTLVVGALGGILLALSRMKIGPTLDTAKSLSLLLIALSGACVILRAVGSGGAAAFVGIGALVTLIAAVGGVLTGLGALVEYFPKVEVFLDKGIPILEKIGYGLGSFAGNIIGGFMEGTMSGLPGIGTKLSQFMENLEPFIEGAKTIDGSVVSGVKSLAETVLILTGARLLDGLTTFLTGGVSFSDFGKEVGEFGKSFKKFAAEVGEIENIDSVEKAASAGKVLAEFAKAIPNQGGKLADWIGDNTLSTFGKELGRFAPWLKAYAINIRELSTEDVERSAKAAMVLAEFAKAVPNQGGILAKWVGDNTLSTFGKELGRFAPYLKAYAINISGLDTEDVERSAKAAMVLAEFAKALPNQGGALSWIVGDNKLSAFGKELGDFAPWLKAYAINVRELNTEDIEKSVNAAKILSEFAKSVPNEGGALSWLLGDNKLSTFGKELGNFAPWLKTYSVNVRGLSVEDVETSARAGEILADLAKKLPSDGGLFSLFTGDKSMKAFGKDLLTFGESLVDYCNAVTEVGIEDVTGAVDVAVSLVNLQNRLQSNDTRLSDFGTVLSSFGKSFKSYYDYVSDIQTSKLNGVGAQAQRLIEMSDSIKAGVDAFQSAMSDVGRAQVTGFTFGIDNASSRVTRSASDLVARFADGVRIKQQSVVTAFEALLMAALFAIKNKESGFQSAGQSVMDRFISGISSRGSTISSACASVVGGAANVLSYRFNDFYNAGVHLVNGFANGIDANRYAAEAAASAMASAAANAARRALDEHSPSRVFYGIGDYAGIEFVKALGSYTSKAYKAGTRIAGSAVDGLSNAISRVSETIESGIDTQPTIRPVLDLSDVQSGVGAISGMLSGRRTLSIGAVQANVSSAAASMQRYQNGDGQREVVSAIKALRKDIADMPRNTYHVGGITYDDGSNVASAVKSLVRAARIERRV